MRFPTFLTVMLALLMFTAFNQVQQPQRAGAHNSGIAYAAPKPADDDDIEEDDDDLKPPAKPGKPGKPGVKPVVQVKKAKVYLPAVPELKKMKLEALGLAEEFARLLSERAKLQPRLSELEANEAVLRYERLKYEVIFFKQRDAIAAKNPQDKTTLEKLAKQDAAYAHVEDLVVKEEKIDCYHTIIERRHKATEEYHWNLLDNKHSLIGEYLSDLPWKGHEEEFRKLYAEMIDDYKRIIEDNKKILSDLQTLIKEKEQREIIMRQAVEEMKKLCAENQN
ncbi:MAG: hypothetical protein LWY06_03845 [Firmicutes bacterium]|nr:hypothetical protein [Bacillota bacterium]